MSDILWLLRSAWKNIWQEKTIFVFSALTYASSLYDMVIRPFQKETPGFFAVLTILILPAFIFLPGISTIGMAHIAHRRAIGQTVSIPESWQVVRKCWKRVTVFYALALLFFSPALCGILLYSFRDGPPQPELITNNAFLVVLPVSILFASLWYFSVAGMVANDFDIRASVKQAWRLFAANFGRLVGLGIVLTGMWQLFSIGLDVCFGLLRSSFDPAVLATLDYIAPSTSFPDDGVYNLAFGLSSIIWLAFNTSVFMVAFVKYGVEKPEPKIIKRRVR